MCAVHALPSYIQQPQRSCTYRSASTICDHSAYARVLTMRYLGIQSTHDREKSFRGYIDGDSPTCWCDVRFLGSRMGDAAGAAPERHRVRHAHEHARLLLEGEALSGHYQSG